MSAAVIPGILDCQPPPDPDWLNDDGTVNLSKVPEEWAELFKPPPPGPGTPDPTLRSRLEVGEDGELVEIVDLSDEK